jgi:mannose-6-phosphate isomerase-like protein (cupin superfamily)
MNVLRSREFKADRAWGSQEVARVDAVTARLHWTDSAYPWHANDGDELFVVLQGVVDMHVRRDGSETVVTLHPGDLFFGEDGLEHSARPRGEARVLVVERVMSP